MPFAARRSAISDRVLPEFDWRSAYANFKRYGARLAARPAFVATAALTADKPPR